MVLALVLNISSYTNFLTLIGSVFVPMFGVLAADYFLAGRSADWDTSVRARWRWGMLVAWLLGLAVYQLINPGSVGAWSTMWSSLARALHFTPQGWMSASLLSFAVSGLVAYLVDLATGRRTGSTLKD
jgi:purine-cytosine permease-like protein